MPTPRRRLADKVIDAFEQACAERELTIAEELFWALEAAVSRGGAPAGAERRTGQDYVMEASARLDRLKRELEQAPVEVGE